MGSDYKSNVTFKTILNLKIIHQKLNQSLNSQKKLQDKFITELKKMANS